MIYGKHQSRRLSHGFQLGDALLKSARTFNAVPE